MNGRAVPAPSWDAHFVEVCLHAAVGDGLGRALSVRDVAQVLAHPELDVGHALELSRRWKVTPIVGTAVRATVEAFGIALPDELAQLVEKQIVAGPPVAASVRSSRSRLAELRGGGIRRRLAVARSLVVPSREFLRFTYGEDHSTADLYVRRWRTLFRRSLDARGTRPRPRRPRRRPRRPGSRRCSIGPRRARPTTGARSRPPRPPPSAATAPRRHRHSGPGRRPPAAHDGRTRPVRHDLARAGRGGRDEDRRGRRTRRRVAVGGGDAAAAEPAAALGRGAPARLARRRHRPRSAPARGGAATVAAAAERRRDGGRASGRTGTRLAAVGSGAPMCVGGILVLLAATCLARVGVDWSGVVLVPLAGILFAMSLWRHLERTRPAEAWVGRWMVLGVVAKIAASYFRYTTLVSSYKGVGDASDYDNWGRQFAQFWMGNGPEPYLPDLRKTNFIRWFTGVVYYVFGSNVVAGFFVFGLLALIGSYLWYRATADSVPFLDKRLYLGLVLFAPSLAFWPSSIGKESLMQLGLGVMALAVAMFLKQRLLARAADRAPRRVAPVGGATAPPRDGDDRRDVRLRRRPRRHRREGQQGGRHPHDRPHRHRVHHGVQRRPDDEVPRDEGPVAQLGRPDPERAAGPHRAGRVQLRQRRRLPESGQPAARVRHRAAATVPVGGGEPVPAPRVGGVRRSSRSSSWCGSSP